MPFTLAHPAAILVFRYVPSKWYSWSGLIIGSMVPDLAAIFLIDTEKVFGHTLPGMLLLDLPLGLLVWLGFYFIIRDPLLANMPSALRARLMYHSIKDVPGYFGRRYVIISVSLLIGIDSHLIWDSLTHQNPGLPFLNEHVGPGAWRMQRYLWLQYISSLIGLFALGIALYNLPVRRVKKSTRIQWLFWPVVIVITAMTAGVMQCYVIMQNNQFINSLLFGLSLGLITASLLNRVSIHHSK